jgi:hypothetical protein
MTSSDSAAPAAMSIRSRPPALHPAGVDRLDAAEQAWDSPAHHENQQQGQGRAHDLMRPAHSAVPTKLMQPHCYAASHPLLALMAADTAVLKQQRGSAPCRNPAAAAPMRGCGVPCSMQMSRILQPCLLHHAVRQRASLSDTDHLQRVTHRQE